jgi:hypothetical protein
MQDSPLVVGIIFLESAIAVGFVILGFLGLRWLHRRYTVFALGWGRHFCTQHKRVLLIWIIASVLLGMALRTVQIMEMVRHQHDVYPIK